VLMIVIINLYTNVLWGLYIFPACKFILQSHQPVIFLFHDNKTVFFPNCKNQQKCSKWSPSVPRRMTVYKHHEGIPRSYLVFAYYWDNWQLHSWSFHRLSILGCYSWDGQESWLKKFGPCRPGRNLGVQLKKKMIINKSGMIVLQAKEWA
jgi:hypothetical protein